MSFVYVKRYGGFCNSLILWQFAYRVAALNGVSVAVCKNHFPEFKFLDVPNTILLNEEPKNIQLINSNDFNSKFTINFNSPIQFICEWNFNKCFQDEIDKPISKIKLKNKELESIIRSTCSDYIGLHLRRGDYKAIPEAYTNDEWYYDKCLVNNKEKIYLSTDGTEDDINFLKEFNIKRYNLFVPKKQLLSINCHYLSENNRHKFADSLSTVDEDLMLIKIIDLFSLSYCKIIYGSESTFSLLSGVLNGASVIYPRPKYNDVMKKFL
jgi:hypothetical protein